MLDPFMGSGTTAVAAVRTGRHYLGYDTDEAYVKAARERADAEVARVQADPGPPGPTRRSRRPATRSRTPASRSPTPKVTQAAPLRRRRRRRLDRHRRGRRRVARARRRAPARCMRTGLRRSDVLFRTLGEAVRAHHRRPPGARAHHRPPGARLGGAGRRSRPPAASPSSTRSSSGATGVAARLAAYAAGGQRRPRRRAAARALTRRSPLPSAKTEITEIVTGAGHRRRGHASRRRWPSGGWPTWRRRGVGAARRRRTRPGSTARSSPPRGPTARPSCAADEGCAAGRRRWWSGRGPPRRPATRWCRPTSASTTCG